MSKETTIQTSKTGQGAKSKVDVQAFVQKKLQVLNQKSGGQYERTAARVVRNNM